MADGTSEWDQFRRDEPWLFPGAKATVGATTRAVETLELDDQLRSTFPRFTSLLLAANVTPVRLTVRRRTEDLLLYGWSRRDGGRFGWLSPVPDPEAAAREGVCPDHAALLRRFGGVTERWGEPDDTWLLNLHEALTGRDTVVDDDLPL